MEFSKSRWSRLYEGDGFYALFPRPFEEKIENFLAIKFTHIFESYFRIISTYTFYGNNMLKKEKYFSNLDFFLHFQMTQDFFWPSVFFISLQSKSQSSFIHNMTDNSLFRRFRFRLFALIDKNVRLLTDFCQMKNSFEKINFVS